MVICQLVFVLSQKRLLELQSTIGDLTKKLTVEQGATKDAKVCM